MTDKPIIGLTLDIEEPAEGAFSKWAPWYALRDNYCNAVAKHGAVPLLLPHYHDNALDYLKIVDGVVTTGGDFDIDPNLYGETEIHEKVSLKRERTAFEYALIEGALEQEIPILGICGGEQLLNVVCGGSLIQHIPDVIESNIAHEQGKIGVDTDKSSHDVVIEEGTKLHEILGVNSLHVNSTHHQAVKEPGEGVVVSARAEDGVIEAIEVPAHPFCVGVQWHPEYAINAVEEELFKSFVEACSG